MLTYTLTNIALGNIVVFWLYLCLICDLNNTKGMSHLKAQETEP